MQLAGAGIVMFSPVPGKLEYEASQPLAAVSASRVTSNFSAILDGLSPSSTA